MQSMQYSVEVKSSINKCVKCHRLLSMRSQKIAQPSQEFSPEYYTFITLPYCYDCKVYQVHKDDIWNIQEKNVKRQSEIRNNRVKQYVFEKVRINVLPLGTKFQHDMSAAVNWEAIVYLYSKHPSCSKEGHSLENVSAIVNCSQFDNQVEINVAFCQRCFLYFIGMESFNSYQEKYGIIDVDLRFDEGFALSKKYSENTYDSFATESKLFILGYSVKQGGLPQSDRQIRLAEIIEFGQLNKYDILKHIEGCIARGRSNPNHQSAVEKWKQDLAFLNDYDIHKQDKVFATIVKRAKGKR